MAGRACAPRTVASARPNQGQIEHHLDTLETTFHTLGGQGSSSGEHNDSGWDESGMGEAMRLAVEGKDSEEFKIAARMESRGELFEKYTMKKSANLAEKELAAEHARCFQDADLHGDTVAAQIEHGPAGQVSAPDPDDEQYVWHDAGYAGAMSTLRQHITHHQNLVFVDETTQPSNKKRSNKKRKA